MNELYMQNIGILKTHGFYPGTQGGRDCVQMIRSNGRGADYCSVYSDGTIRDNNGTYTLAAEYLTSLPSPRAPYPAIEGTCPTYTTRAVFVIRYFVADLLVGIINDACARDVRTNPATRQRLARQLVAFRRGTEGNRLRYYAPYSEAFRR